MMAAIRYEPAIDGLRSIAILAVIVFHLSPRWLPGGFAGVDVFFVISGYLITSIQLAEMEQRTFRLSRYYQKRIARIFPAMICAACVTMMMAALLYDAQERAAAGANFTASILSLENMKVMLQGNYFQLSRDNQPFMHFWSLSVEEQFYVLFPLLLMVAHGLGRRVLATGLFLLTAASLVACVILTHYRPSMAFFLLPSRAWELLFGAILACQVRWGRDSAVPASTSILQIAGMSGLVASFVLLDETQPFPGVAALLPALATVALIAGVRGGEGVVAAALGHWAPVLIGRLSYSLYLWHWPIDSFVDYAYPRTAELQRAGVKCAATLACAWLSYRYVEGPLRRRLAVPGTARAAFGMAIASCVLLAPIGVFVNRQGYPQSWRQDVARGGRVFNAGGPRGIVSLYGDSIAASFTKVIVEACREKGFECRSMAVPAAQALPAGGGLSDDPLWDDAIRAWKRDRPDMVILGVNWAIYHGRKPDFARRVIDELEPLTDRIVILSEAPMLPVPEVRSFLRSGGSLPLLEDVEQGEVRKQVNSSLRAVAGGKVVVIDVDSFLVDENGLMTVVDSAGRSLFHDKRHLGYRGASLVGPQLRRELDRVGERSGP